MKHGISSVFRVFSEGLLVTFPSALGWMALIGSGKTLRQLTFGHSSSQAAARALDPALCQNARPGAWNDALVRRLLAFAVGEPVDFRDVSIDPGPVSDFRRRVIHHCRQIPYGETLTYGKLAVRAGSPRAARAVGRCMALNRIPLIVPCHRVIPADGSPGAFSAPGGTRMKRRLLTLEV